MTAHYAITSTPVGPFTIIVDSDDQVLASGWTAELTELTALIHPSLRPERLHKSADLGAITAAITAYHEGELDPIATIFVQQQSGPFLMHAWAALRTVPAGNPITYSDFATLAGRPPAIRAAASACAKNAAALFVPCHRVVRTGGNLGGFRYGLAIKEWLLHHESSAQTS
ncbi:MAG: methylated-DNA--[protein]-cysteine S-methyltransferase [Mycobacteriaceae bacterium]